MPIHHWRFPQHVHADAARRLQLRPRRAQDLHAQRSRHAGDARILRKLRYAYRLASARPSRLHPQGRHARRSQAIRRADDGDLHLRQAAVPRNPSGTADLRAHAAAMSAFAVTPFKQGEPKTFTTLLCDGYHLSRPPSFRALLDVLHEKEALHPEARLLATLDNFPQASYTSGHATDTHELDDTTGYDLSRVDPAALEDGEHRGYLTTKSEFFIRRGNLMKKAEAVTYADARGKLVWGRDNYDLDFFSANTRPDEIIDGEIYIQIVPVARACEA